MARPRTAASSKRAGRVRGKIPGAGGKGTIQRVSKKQSRENRAIASVSKPGKVVGKGAMVGVNSRAATVRKALKKVKGGSGGR